MSIPEQARVAFRHAYSGILDAGGTVRRDKRSEVPEWWSDELSELADSLIPAYDPDAVRLWLRDGCPDPDDYGLTEGLTDAKRIIRAILYERFLYELHGLAYAAGFFSEGD